MKHTLNLLLAVTISLGMLSTAGAASSASVGLSKQQALPSLAPMLQKVMPAVVNITTERPHTPSAANMAGNKSDSDDSNSANNNALQSPPSLNAPEQSPSSMGLASGVIVDPVRGYILTNQHVVAGADQIQVGLGDGRRFNAKLIGGDPESDIAVIQIQANKLSTIPMGDSSKLNVGDFVVAIGNPFGLKQSVTSGIVSALGRVDLHIEGVEDFIQTDASINPGNSGGALVNLRGELIGINTAILAPSGGNIGIGFAIPISMARNVMDQLIKYGKVRRGLLGVLAQNLTPELAEGFKVNQTHGAVIDQVMKDSLAEKAGLKAGDIVLAVNHHPVSSAGELRNSIGLIPIGQTLSINLIRDGKITDINTSMVDPRSLKTEAERIHAQLAGTLFGNFSQEMAGFGLVRGVEFLSVDPMSPAWRMGFRPGDVIVSVNQQPITSVAALKQVAATGQSNVLLLRVLRKTAALYLVLK